MLHFYPEEIKSSVGSLGRDFNIIDADHDADDRVPLLEFGLHRVLPIRFWRGKRAHRLGKGVTRNRTVFSTSNSNNSDKPLMFSNRGRRLLEQPDFGDLAAAAV